MIDRLYSESHGSGPNLVLWHGWGMNLRVFDPLIEHLAAYFRVTTVDLPGHGRSPELMTKDFEAVLPTLISELPDDCTLAGWSLGGMLALRAAELAPERVRALILLHSTPKFVATPDWSYGIASTVLDQFAHALEVAQQQTVSNFLDLQVRGSRDADRLLQQLRESLQVHGHARASALAAGLELLRSADLRATARRIDLPALLISGQYDRVTPPGAAHAMADLMRHAQLEELPRTGHAGFLSQAEDVAKRCIRWWQARVRVPVSA
jgi:pimeloyl-[acyl-carrier protein] methyl ester esterase